MQQLGLRMKPILVHPLQLQRPRPAHNRNAALEFLKPVIPTEPSASFRYQAKLTLPATPKSPSVLPVPANLTSQLPFAEVEETPSAKPLCPL